jgi:hypothetical protein
VSAWGYPLRGNAKWLLLGWAFVLVYVAPWFSFFFLAGILIVVLMLGTLAMYEFELIRQSAYDAEAAPRLPGYEDLYESVFRPLGHIMAAVGAAALPLAIVAFIGWDRPMPGWWDGLTVACYLLMAFIMPANLLAVATADDFGAVDPRYTLSMITRIPVQYVVCCITCIAFYKVSALVAQALMEGIGGMFLGTFLGVLVRLYLLSVAAHILGALHYANEERIGWVA